MRSSALLLFGLVCGMAVGQEQGAPPSRIVNVVGRAAGSTPAAAEEAKLDALREAVRQVCGSFINAQTQGN